MCAFIHQLHCWLRCALAGPARPVSPDPPACRPTPKVLAIEELEERAAPGVIWGT